MIAERILPDRSHEWADTEPKLRCIDCQTTIVNCRRGNRLRCPDCKAIENRRNSMLRARRLRAERHGVSLKWYEEKKRYREKPVPSNLAADLIIHAAAKKYSVQFGRHDEFACPKRCDSGCSPRGLR